MLYLIDGSSQMYRAYHAPVRTAEGGLLRNAQGTPTNAVYIFVNMLRKLLNEHQPEFIAASFDLPGRTFRDELVDDYKANRAPMPGELAQQIPMVHAACEALGVPILTSERYEADDVIGTLALKAVAAGFEVAIVTMDKDFYQLVGDHIRVYNPRDEGTWYDAEGVKEKFGVAPDHVVDVLALMGDTIDNIKGVPGVGEKGARELIVQYGSLDNLLAHAAEVKNKRYREGLLGNMDAARQSRELARIRIDVPVEFDAEQLRYRAGSREARLRDLQRARLPRARQGIRAHRRHHRQDLPGGQHRRRRARAGRAAARGRPVRVPRAAGRRDRDARGDCRDFVLDLPARRRLRADRPPLARQHRQPAARDRAGGAAADSRGRRPQEGGPRSEVRRDRAGPPRRHARAGSTSTPCWRATCSTRRARRT